MTRRAALIGSTSLHPQRAASVRAPLVLTELEAADMLRLSPRTLQRLRLEGGGPRFMVLSLRRIGYPVAELEAWIAKNAVESTSGRRAAGQP